MFGDAYDTSFAREPMDDFDLGDIDDELDALDLSAYDHAYVPPSSKETK